MRAPPWRAHAQHDLAVMLARSPREPGDTERALDSSTKRARPTAGSAWTHGQQERGCQGAPRRLLAMPRPSAGSRLRTVRATPKVVAQLARLGSHDGAPHRGARRRRPARPEERAPGDAYGDLLRSIVEQQLATKAARTVYGRMLELFGGHPPTPKRLLAPDPDGCAPRGSRDPRSTSCATSPTTSRAASSSCDRLDDLPDEEMIEQLTAVKGIGESSAHMSSCPPEPPERAARRRPRHPQRGQAQMPAGEDPRRPADGEDREAPTAQPHARLPLPLELARRQAGDVAPAGPGGGWRRAP